MSRASRIRKLNILQSSDPDILFIAADMANIHNAIIRGLNAIYLQCPHIPNNPTDIQDFALYVKAWADLVHHHHSMEEAKVFPRFESVAKDAGKSEAVMDANIEQHHQFEPGLAELMDIANKVHKGEKEYDWEEWIRILDRVAEVLTQHLHDEIDSLLALEKLGKSKELRTLYDKAVEEGAKASDVVSAYPYDALGEVRLMWEFRTSCFLLSLVASTGPSQAARISRPYRSLSLGSIIWCFRGSIKDAGGLIPVIIGGDPESYHSSVKAIKRIRVNSFIF
jgi:hemerythrin-like domain-containing protein